MDEIGNLTRFLHGVQFTQISLLPIAFYNDRPVGFVLERYLFNAFGFNYSRQIGWFLVVHFANLILGFSLIRRLGASRLLSFAALGVFGGLWTTAQTATYIGAIFDVVCLFFLLATFLLFLSSHRWGVVMSLVTFILALRSKEFAIVTPLLLLTLAIAMREKLGLDNIRSAALRTSPHLLVGLVFLTTYVRFLPKALIELGPANPYHISVNPGTILRSFVYYAALTFAQESSLSAQVVVFVCITVGLSVYLVIRRNVRVMFLTSAYILMLLPVALLPAQRAPFYVYAPQMFMLFAFALVLDDVFTWRPNSEVRRWISRFTLALGALSVILCFREGSYFRDRINFTIMVRRTSARTASQALVLLPKLPARSRIFIDHGQSTPWLFAPGTCSFFVVVNHDESISCIMNMSKADLVSAYEESPAPRYYLTYADDGSLGALGGEAALAPFRN